MSDQPKWELLANLGDVNPLEYGGYFIYRDRTGVYGPEAEYLDTNENESDNMGEPTQWTVYRIQLDRCTWTPADPSEPPGYDPYHNPTEPIKEHEPRGYLSDNKFHPHHRAWWASVNGWGDKLHSLAEFVGCTKQELIDQFCSDDPLERAQAYRAVGEHWGFNELDSDPLVFGSLEEVTERYGTTFNPQLEYKRGERDKKLADLRTLSDEAFTVWREAYSTKKGNTSPAESLLYKVHSAVCAFESAYKEYEEA